MHRRTALLIASLALVFSSSAAAQGADTPHARRGLWMGAGLSAGHAQLDCSGCGRLAADDPWRGGLGMSGYLALGGAVRSNLLLGVELNSYDRDTRTSERELIFGTATVVAQLYPIRTTPLFVRAGAGVGQYFLVDGTYLHSFLGKKKSGVQSDGRALHVGAGYDVPITRGFALVPFASVVKLLAEGVEEHTSRGVVRGPGNPRFLQAGLGVHWYYPPPGALLAPRLAH